MALSREEVAAYLDKAVELMNDSGAHWHQGHWFGRNNEDQTTYCSLAAIRCAVDGGITENSEESVQVRNALAAVLPPSEDESLDPFYGLSDRVTLWNDKEGRTWEEVVDKFKEAKQRVLAD